MFMQTPTLVRSSLLSAVMALSACSTLPPAEPSAVSTADRVSSQGLDKAAVGSRITLPANNALGVSSVQIVDEYRAASGRLCRRVQVSPTDDSSRVMCQRKNGQWSFTRALISNSLRQTMKNQPLVSTPLSSELMQDGQEVVDTAAQAMVLSAADTNEVPGLGNAMATAADASAPPVQLRLNPGETLWRFAARTTGNPENWTHIAKLNGISDVGKLQGGTMLNIPAELFAGSR